MSCSIYSKFHMLYVNLTPWHLLERESKIRLKFGEGRPEMAHLKESLDHSPQDTWMKLISMGTHESYLNIRRPVPSECFVPHNQIKAVYLSFQGQPVYSKNSKSPNMHMQIHKTVKQDCCGTQNVTCTSISLRTLDK